jgi:hypothetical protein
MPVKMGKKKFKTFKGAVKSTMKKKGLSKKRASAYVAAVEMRRTGKSPRTGKRINRTKLKRLRSRTTRKKTRKRRR